MVSEVSVGEVRGEKEGVGGSLGPVRGWSRRRLSRGGKL